MERIGKYQIRATLGYGASSTVYLGYDPFALREVAVKLFHPEVLQDPSRGKLYRYQLLNEASLAGKLLHPHIVHILDAVMNENESYIVMEYVEGGTLEQFSSPENLLPLERLVEIVFKCSRALDYAYRMGVTHRDIKPANILLQQAGGGDIKVSDFGASITSGSDRTQISGVGSPAYMSPEQVRERPLNHQTDIYSLGVVMYRLLAGRAPFSANNHYNLVYQIIHDEPPPPSRFRSDIPPSIDAIVARAMAKRLGARYADWEAFSHDLALAFRDTQPSIKRITFPDSEKFETLRKLAFFAKFNDVEIWEVLRFSHWEEVAPKTVIMKEGATGDFFCILAEGQLKVRKNGRILERLGPGECFGEMAVVGNNRRGADIVAQTRAKIISIGAQALDQASEPCRMHCYLSFLKVISDRLGVANTRLAPV